MNIETLVAKYSIKTFSPFSGENVEKVALLRHILTLVEKYDAEKNDATIIALANLLQFDEGIFDEYLQGKVEENTQGSVEKKRLVFLAIKGAVDEVKL